MDFDGSDCFSNLIPGTIKQHSAFAIIHQTVMASLADMDGTDRCAQMLEDIDHVISLGALRQMLVKV